MYFGFAGILIFTSNIIKCRLYFFNPFARPVFLRMHIKNHRTMANINVVPFKGQEDRFGGITVDSSTEDCTTEHLLSKLEKSLQEWERTNKRGIWFKVALEHATWVPLLAKNGFDFHHARNGFVVMYKWLPKNEDCNIPCYAHTMIGVGAVVINEDSKILVVREKYWNIPHWKLPGGYVEPDENVVDAAIREVFEETKIRTEFCSLVTLRHAHKAMFECSDIYFVVSLKPLTVDIERCDRELLAAQWLDVNEYLNHPNIHELNRFFVQSYLDSQKSKIKIECKHGIHQLLKKTYTVYYPTQDLPKSMDDLKLQDNL